MRGSRGQIAILGGARHFVIGGVCAKTVVCGWGEEKVGSEDERRKNEENERRSVWKGKRRGVVHVEGPNTQANTEKVRSSVRECERQAKTKMMMKKKKKKKEERRSKRSNRQ